MTRKLLLIAAALSLLICALLISCSGNKNGTDGGDGGDDGNMPFVILTLHVKSVNDSTVTLGWTATGDDADRGTASRYDLRYYRDWLNLSNWSEAIQVTGEPSPKVAGSAEEFVVRNLKKDSTYFFAIVACDEASNCTNPSNCVPATCFEDIVVAFADAHLEAVIRTAVNKPTGDIHRSDLMGLTFIDANERSIVSLAGLQYCTNLIAALLAFNQISDLTPLAGLTKFLGLQMVGNQISDISPLAGWHNVEQLILRQNHISDVTAVANMNRLHWLDISYNNVSDLAPLAANLGLATNDTVYIGNNPLSQQSLEVHIPAIEARGCTVIR